MNFNLKKEWFYKIKNEKKTHEYREFKPYWNKRINKLKKGDVIVFVKDTHNIWIVKICVLQSFKILNY